MANITNYLEEGLLDHVFRDVNFDRPGTTLYVGIFLSTKAEGELEANNKDAEITDYTGTNRPSVSFNWKSPKQQGGKATIESAAAVEFLNMPAVTMGYAAIFDSAAHAGGNMLYWMPVLPNKTTNAGDTFFFPAGDIVLDLD